jgi:hypothetical protein
MVSTLWAWIDSDKPASHGFINFIDTKAYMLFFKNRPAGKFSGINFPALIFRH